MVVAQFRTTSGAELLVIGLADDDRDRLEADGVLAIDGETGDPPRMVRLIIIEGADDDVRAELQRTFEAWIHEHQMMHMHPEDN